jgi:molecular chaperone DnaK
MHFINYAIDLGTTNSLIAKHHEGNVQLFKNPKGFKETLPSVVAFRKTGMLVGDKAKELKDRDPQNVFSSFKRKMGTDEHFFVPLTQETIDPIKLSTIVLNELKTFVRDEQPCSVVITIPASFDTIQSNATKKAGFDAGFEEVVLLQEPIAACLAIFNQQHVTTQNGKWLIYDLGGGTFDVAIVSATEEELKIIDHEGNNFLGGLDFDILILNELILPQLKQQGAFSQLVELLKTNPDHPSVQSTYNYLLFYAEQLKIELTSYPESFTDFTLKDDNGDENEISISIKRDDFNRLIDQNLQYTVNLVNDLLTVNGLTADDFTEIVLVGGSTYIPYVQEKLVKELGIGINQRVDPTNAIAIGAAYYAGNKASKLTQTVTKKATATFDRVSIKPIYERQSREHEELIMLKAEGDPTGLLFRVFRKDLGYDSGKKPLGLTQRITLPLQLKTTNEFQVEIYDESGALLDSNAATIQISQGLFVIDGQPLPHDICIEVDDVIGKETVLEAIFDKNAILPLTRTIYKMLSRDLLQSSDDALIINIMEGDKNASPATNQVIGCLAIRPKEIGHNLFRDTDIGITLSISESRDLTVSANISLIDYEIKNIFSPTQKTVHLPKLREEFAFLHHQISKDLEEMLAVEEFEQAAALQQLKLECEQSRDTIGFAGEIASDTKFHHDEMKRQIAIRYDKLVKKQKLLGILEEYRSAKDEFEYYMKQPDFPDRLKMTYQDILRKEQAAIAGSNIHFLRSLERQLRDLSWEYEKNSIGSLRSIYLNYKFLPPDAFVDKQEASRLFEIGDDILNRESTSPNEFLNLLGRLWHQLTPAYKRNSGSSDFDLKGTGIR